MARWFVEHGHDVRVLAAYPYYPRWRLEARYRRAGWRRQEVDGIKTYRCPLYVPEDPTPILRLVHLLSYGLSSAPVVIWQAMTWKPDVIVAIQPTAFAAPATALAAVLSGAVSWMHIQDFEVEAAVGAGHMKGVRLPRLGIAIESGIIRLFDFASSISPTMVQRLSGKTGDSKRVRFLPNWVDTEEIMPLRQPSALRAQLGFANDEVIALYAGNLGRSQGLETLVDAARALSGERLQLVIAGDGAVKAEIKSMSCGLGNVHFLPLQPAERLNELLNLGDIHLLPRRRGVVDCNMPSKLLNMLASGRPIVAAADEGSDVEQIVRSCGIVVPPEDGIAMAAAVKRLAGDPQGRAQLGAAGRHRAITHWSRDTVLRQFEQCFEEARSPTRRSTPDGPGDRANR
jgi:colanic acid biosynthesis glycosyl transferase WcaI